MGLKHNILHRDGAPKVYESPAMTGQYIYFTNRGDDMENGMVGEGQKLFIENIEGLEEQSVKIQFLEDIQIKDAYVFWENAVWGDSISIEVILPANTLFESNTNHGNVIVVDGVPTPVTESQVPDDTWTGTHMYFPTDVSLIRFCNEIALNGTNTVGTIFESKGVALINKELQLKMIVKSETKNKDIKLAITAEIYRERTL
jgi:hypothetical protein